MLFFLSLITFINFLGLIYLVFIFYKKNSKKGNNLALDSNFKINLTRFNPFDDLGGDQSFILTLLDKNNSGVVVTSLHNRDITRIYAKSIKKGEGENSVLSKEEKLAILKTIKN